VRAFCISNPELSKTEGSFFKTKAEGIGGGSLHRYKKAEVPRALKIFRIIVYYVLPPMIIIGLIIYSKYIAD
jgi:hypothetical protein